jgi:hypothetical protein
LLPLSEVRRVSAPGTFTGYGDDVVLLTGGTPDLLKVDATAAKGNFAIWTYGSARDLVVNEIAPYTGTVLVGSDSDILVISAERAWSIEVTTR